ncbi:MAG TPA: ATP-binding protein [Thermoanaerobaculia bacterium]
MKPSTTRERRSVWRVGPESTWTTILPVVFIILSLVSLAVLPVVVSRKTAGMREEISRIAEPARRAANAIQMDLSGELDKIIAYQVTGQTQYRREYYERVRRQDVNREALAQLLPHLDEELGTVLTALFAETTRWHEGVARGELVSRQMPNEVFLLRLFEAHVAYEKSLIAASELQVDLQTAIESRLKGIRDAERINIWLTIVLTVLALTSALLVAGLGRQMRLLAGEAMKRRREAEIEANQAQIARAAAEREERRAAFLAAAGQELAGSLDYDQTISRLAELMVPNLADMVVVDVVESEGSWRRAAVAHRNQEDKAVLELQLGSDRSQMPPSLERIIESGEAALVGASPEIRQFAGADRNEMRTMIILPLASRGHTIGLAVAMSSEARAFSSDDLPLFAELARRASISIDNARLYLHSQQAVRAREEVLAIVSHDLRNPLNAVTLGASLLQMSTTLSDEDREQIDTMEVSAGRMKRLIEDLLDVTRLEGGKRLPIDAAPLAVGELLEETQELFRVQATVASISMEYSVPDDLPLLLVDRHRIMQVMSNIIGNSMKFTPPGGRITVAATAEGNHVRMTVADTGPGIPTDDLGAIFSPYWQAKRTERMGAGLGLPIAKGIVEAHGGAIWAESEPGEGTTFHFTLPLPDSEQLARSAEEST